MSNQTRYPTNQPNSADLTRKPADLTSVTVDCRSPSPKLDTSESDDGFEHKNPIPNQSDRIYTGKVAVLHRWVCFASVLVRLVAIWAYLCKIHRDLVEIWQDLGRFGLILTKIQHCFESFNSDWGPIGIRWVSTTWTNFLHRSAVGPEMRDLNWSSRFWVGHKPDPNRLVDRPNCDISEL